MLLNLPREQLSNRLHYHFRNNTNHPGPLETAKKTLKRVKTAGKGGRMASWFVHSGYCRPCIGAPRSNKLTFLISTYRIIISYCHRSLLRFFIWLSLLLCYTSFVPWNGVGLCWRATRQGITEPKKYVSYRVFRCPRVKTSGIGITLLMYFFANA